MGWSGAGSAAGWSHPYTVERQVQFLVGYRIGNTINPWQQYAKSTQRDSNLDAGVEGTKAKANLQLLQTSTNLRAPPLCEGMHAVQAYTATEWSDGTRHKIEQVKYFEILKQVIWLYFGCLFF